MDKIKKIFNFEIKQLGKEEDRKLLMVGSTETQDRDGDIIEASGWDLTDYKNNPIILGFHEYDKFPYARSEKTYIDSTSKQLMFEVRFPTIEELTSYPNSPEMIAEHAKNVDLAYNMYRNGYMRAVSVGFIGKESEPIMENGSYIGKRYKKQSLLELSLVPVPSCPDALLEARSKGIINDNELKMFEEAKEITTKPGWDETETSLRFRVRDPELFQEGSFRTVPIKKDKPRVNSVMGRLKDEETLTVQSVIFPKEDGWDLADAKTWLSEHEDLTKGCENVEQKSAIPYKKYPLADEGTAWDGPAEIAAAEVADLKLMCAWFDDANADVKQSYKLPHHLQADKKTVWRAVSAAMGALLGARGGVDIPEDDKKSVYEHIAKHYADFGKTAPEFKSYTEAELKAMTKTECCPHTCCVMCENQPCEQRMECCQGCMMCCQKMCEDCEKDCKMDCCAMCQAMCQTMCGACCKVDCSMHTRGTPKAHGGMKSGSAKPQTKKADLEGNPSVSDIFEALWNVVNPAEIYTRGGPYIEDIYPVNYPSGNVIIEKMDKYYLYQYEFKDGIATLTSEGVELDEVYVPKSHKQKSGASLSAKNRETLQAIHDDMHKCYGAMKASQDKLKEFIEGTMPMEPTMTAQMTVEMPMMEPMMSATRTASTDKLNVKVEMSDEIKQALDELKNQVLILCQKTEKQESPAVDPDANKDEIDLDAIELPEPAKDPDDIELDIEPGELKTIIQEAVKNQIQGGN